MGNQSTAIQFNEGTQGIVQYTRYKQTVIHQREERRKELSDMFYKRYIEQPNINSKNKKISKEGIRRSLQMDS